MISSTKNIVILGIVDRTFVTKFLAFMEKNDYMVSAQNKYLVDLRAIVNYAYLDGMHDNDRAMQYFAKKKIEEEDKAIEIYLTEAELQVLYEMPLTGKQVRCAIPCRLLHLPTCERLQRHRQRLFHYNCKGDAGYPSCSEENAQ